MDAPTQDHVDTNTTYGQTVKSSLKSWTWVGNRSSQFQAQNYRS